MAPRAAERGATDDNDYVHFVAAGGDRDARAAQHESERIEAIHFSIPEVLGWQELSRTRLSTREREALYPYRADAVAGGRGGAAKAP